MGKIIYLGIIYVMISGQTETLRVYAFILKSKEVLLC